MKRFSIALSVLLGLIFCLALAQAAGAQAPERDMAREQAILDRLAAINPEAVPYFQGATGAADAGDYFSAKAGYERVLALAPDFPDALRRLSYVESDLGNDAASITLAQRAVNLDPTPINQMAAAQALLSNGDQSDDQEALTYARRAAAGLPDDYEAQLVWAVAAGRNDDLAGLRQAVGRLLALAPDDPTAHYLAGITHASDRRWEDAERELLLARDLGMSPDMVQGMLDDGVTSQARLARWMRRLGYALFAWAGGLLALLGAGALLNGLTLAATRRAQASGQFTVSAGERAIRTLYRVVILLASLAFYVSIPFLILLILASAGGVLYFLFSSGTVNVRLAGTVAIGALLTLYAIIRSLFTRLSEGEPGRPLGREEAPQIWDLAGAVAGRVGVRPIDAIYITPGAGIAVSERGGFWKKLRGAGQRDLILGLGALAGLRQGQLRAILAHEYGHFSNRDTAGGDLALRALISMYHIAGGLAAGGQAHWYNPAWFFVNGYYRLFLRITQGASRLQEILADRFAALTYGARTFADGLLGVARQNIFFNAQVDAEISRAPHALQNLYALPGLNAHQCKEAEKTLAEARQAKTSPYASHPALGERLALLERMAAGDASAVPDDDAPAWSLFPDAAPLQAEMTALVQENVRQNQSE